MALIKQSQFSEKHAVYKCSEHLSTPLTDLEVTIIEVSHLHHFKLVMVARHLDFEAKSMAFHARKHPVTDCI